MLEQKVWLSESSSKLKIMLSNNLCHTLNYTSNSTNLKSYILNYIRLKRSIYFGAEIKHNNREHLNVA